jgi:galactoside O-acetyltransferase
MLRCSDYQKEKKPNFAYNMKTQLEIEIEKMMSGQLYDANYNDQLLPLLEATSEKCWEYNHLLRPSQVAEREALLRGLLGKTGKRFKINQPFYCDYGFNIEIGEDFFANFNLVILDEAKVKIGDHVYIAPNCGLYTAGHPLDVGQRNAGMEYSLPITVGNNVWMGAGVHVMPGVTIGDNTVIGAGSIVVHDIPAGVLAVGNPCRPVRKIH